MSFSASAASTAHDELLPSVTLIDVLLQEHVILLDYLSTFYASDPSCPSTPSPFLT